MSDTRKPTYDQLSALCAQMAAALEALLERRKAYDESRDQNQADAYYSMVKYARPAWDGAQIALTAYRNLSPDAQWQRVPEGCVVLPVDDETKEAITEFGYVILRDERTHKDTLPLKMVKEKFLYSDLTLGQLNLIRKFLNRARGAG